MNASRVAAGRGMVFKCNIENEKLYDHIILTPLEGVPCKGALQLCYRCRDGGERVKMVVNDDL